MLNRRGLIVTLAMALGGALLLTPVISFANATDYTVTAPERVRYRKLNQLLKKFAREARAVEAERKAAQATAAQTTAARIDGRRAPVQQIDPVALEPLKAKLAQPMPERTQRLVELPAPRTGVARVASDVETDTDPLFGR